MYHLEFPRPEDGNGRSGDSPFNVEIRIQVRPLRGKTVGMSEARVSIRPVWERGPRVGRVLEQTAPQIFESLRSFLQASPEQRIEERLPFSHPVRVFPLRDGHEIGEPIHGMCEDISRTGIRFHVKEPLPTEEIYLNWSRINRVAPFALLAQVVRVRQVEGGFDVGATFNGPLL